MPAEKHETVSTMLPKLVCFWQDVAAMFTPLHWFKDFVFLFVVPVRRNPYISGKAKLSRSQKWKCWQLCCERRDGKRSLSSWVSVEQAGFVSGFLLCSLTAVTAAKIWEQRVSEGRVWGHHLEPRHWNSTGRVPVGVLIRIAFPQGSRCPRLHQFAELDWELENGGILCSLSKALGLAMSELILYARMKMPLPVLHLYSLCHFWCVRVYTESRSWKGQAERLQSRRHHSSVHGTRRYRETPAWWRQREFCLWGGNWWFISREAWGDLAHVVLKIKNKKGCSCCLWQQGEAQWMYLAILKGWFSCILELVGAVTGCVILSRTEGDLRGAVSFCHCWLTRRRCGAESQTVVTREAYQRGEEAKEEQDQGCICGSVMLSKLGSRAADGYLQRVAEPFGGAGKWGPSAGSKLGPSWCWQVGGGNELSARELPGQQGTLTAATGTMW